MVCDGTSDQDITFLQPSTIYKTRTKEDITLPEPNPTEIPLNTSQKTNPPQEEDNNPSQAFLAELSYDRTRIPNRSAPI